MFFLRPPTQVLWKPTQVLWKPTQVLWPPTQVLWKLTQVLWPPTQVLWKLTQVLWEPTQVLWELTQILLEKGATKNCKIKSQHLFSKIRTQSGRIKSHQVIPRSLRLGLMILLGTLAPIADRNRDGELRGIKPSYRKTTPVGRIR